MKKLFVLILGLYYIAAYPMSDQMDNDQNLPKIGSFNIKLFSVKMSEERRFQAEQFRNILETIDLSFLPPEAKECEPDAFVAALEFLPTYFCQDDEVMVAREVSRTLLMYPEIRQEDKYKITIDIWITKYLSLLINKEKYRKEKLKEPIEIILSGIPDALPEKREWSDHINKIINSQILDFN